MTGAKLKVNNIIRHILRAVCIQTFKSLQSNSSNRRSEHRHHFVLLSIIAEGGYVAMDDREHFITLHANAMYCSRPIEHVMCSISPRAFESPVVYYDACNFSSIMWVGIKYSLQSVG